MNMYYNYTNECVKLWLRLRQLIRVDYKVCEMFKKLQTDLWFSIFCRIAVTPVSQCQGAFHYFRHHFVLFFTRKSFRLQHSRPVFNDAAFVRLHFVLLIIQDIHFPLIKQIIHFCLWNWLRKTNLQCVSLLERNHLSFSQDSRFADRSFNIWFWRGKWLVKYFATVEVFDCWHRTH